MGLFDAFRSRAQRGDDILRPYGKRDWLLQDEGSLIISQYNYRGAPVRDGI